MKQLFFKIFLNLLPWKYELTFLFSEYNESFTYLTKPFLLQHKMGIDSIYIYILAKFKETWYWKVITDSSIANWNFQLFCYIWEHTD